MAAPALQLACPNCATRLRVRDKSFVGRTVTCPDCRRPLNIQLAPTGELVAVKSDASVSEPAAQPGASEIKPAPPRRRAPVIAAACVVLTGCGALLMFV